MSIKFTKEQISTLLIGLTEGFQTTKPKFSVLVNQDFGWVDELERSLSDDARAKLERFIGEKALVTFVISEIELMRLTAGDNVKLVKDRPLTQIGALTDPLRAARIIVDQLQTLPHRYRVTAALPLTFSQPLIGDIHHTFELPNGVFICRGDSLPQPLQTISEITSIDDELYKDWMKGRQEDRSWRSNRYYFSTRLIGYANASQSGALNRQLEDQMTAFFGAAAAMGMIAYDWIDEKEDIKFMTVHEEPSSKIVKTDMHSDAFKSYYPFVGTKSFSNRNKGAIESIFRRDIGQIATIFNESIDCRKLFSACIWFFRAKRNSRTLDAMLQYTIAIEVLLGDRKASEGIGLTNLLASRCAYLLGSSTEHREQIERQFRDVYELRSEIMHEGRHVQRVGDRARVDTAAKLCGAIIKRELAIRAAGSAKSDRADQ